jgi:RNA polymerase sigma-70 factor (ECF subfamily)
MRGEIYFEEVHEEYRPRIVRYLSRLIGDDEAEDIAQEVFEKVNRSLGGFEGRSKLSTWIYRIATNAVLDRFRSTSFRRSLVRDTLEDSLAIDNKNVWTGETENPTDQKLIRKEMSECVREYIDKLSPDHRTVIVLKEIEGFKNREIADILQVSLDTVKIRLHRARTALKKELDNACSFYHTEQGILACDRKPTLIRSKKSD